MRRPIHFIACVAITALDAITLGMLIPFLPFALLHLDATPEIVALLATVYGLAGWVGSPILGMLGDRISKRAIVVASLLISAAAYAAMLANWSIVGILAWQAVAGLMVGREALVRALAIEDVPGDRHARLIGTLTGIGATGAVIGPLVGALPTLLLGEGDHRIIVVGGASLLCLVSGGVAALFLQPRELEARAAVSGDIDAPRSGAPVIRMLGRPLIVQAQVSYGWGVMLATTAIIVHHRFNWSEVETAAMLATVAVGTIVSRLFMMPALIGRVGMVRAAQISIAVAAPSLLATGIASTPACYVATFTLFILFINVVMTIPTLMITQQVPGNLLGTALGWRQAIAAVMTFGVAGIHGLLFAAVSLGAPYVVGALVVICAIPFCRQIHSRSEGLAEANRPRSIS